MSNVLKGGRHTIAAAPKLLNSADPTGFRILTIRLASGSSDVYFGDSQGNVWGFLQADESWTFGPNSGTVRPTDLYLWGTAGDILYYVGIVV